VFDVHVHSGPDVIERLGDDADVAGWYSGAEGFVLKNHFESTVGRAAALRRSSGLEVYGGVALNAQAGGINPVAVAVALAMGARVVWMPTVHARADRQSGPAGPLSGFSRQVSSESFAAPPVDWSTESRLVRIFEMIAEADAVLATGHLSGPEIGWMIPAARAAGVRRMLLTHPSFTQPALPAEQAATLAEAGALAEITAYQLLHQEGCDAAFLATYIRRVGPEHIVLSSDAGQTDSPPPNEALDRLIDALSGEGLDRSRLDAMACDVPRRLVAPAP